MVGWQDVSVEKLVKADWNYKKDFDDPDVVERMAKLRENIKRNGLVVNICVRELPTGFLEVLDGNHRLDVIRDLGLTTAHAYNFGPISEDKAQRISLEINENSFEADPLKMGSLFKSLMGTNSLEDLSKTLPWSPDEMSNYVNMTSFDWSDDKYKKDTEGNDKKSGEDEKFKEIRLPASLVELFEEQMQRARDALAQGLDREVSVDEIVSPFEVILVTFANTPLTAIVADVAGESNEGANAV
jgi:hypothetical protein